MIYPYALQSNCFCIWLETLNGCWLDWMKANSFGYCVDKLLFADYDVPLAVFSLYFGIKIDNILLMWCELSLIIIDPLPLTLWSKHGSQLISSTSRYIVISFFPFLFDLFDWHVLVLHISIYFDCIVSCGMLRREHFIIQNFVGVW